MVIMFFFKTSVAITKIATFTVDNAVDNLWNLHKSCQYFHKHKQQQKNIFKEKFAVSY